MFPRPDTSILLATVQARRILTSIGLLWDTSLLRASVHLTLGVDSQSTAALGLATSICALVHSPLERITVPTEDVVGMLTKAIANKYRQHLEIVGEEKKDTHGSPMEKTNG